MTHHFELPNPATDLVAGDTYTDQNGKTYVWADPDQNGAFGWHEVDPNQSQPPAEPEPPAATEEAAAQTPPSGDNPNPGDTYTDLAGQTFVWALFGDDIWGWSPIN